jgi:hypothetical protein
MMTILNASAAEMWAGYVGSQTPAEFLEISRQQGHTTAEAAVTAYVADIPNMFDVTLTAQEATLIENALLAYIQNNA